MPDLGHAGHVDGDRNLVVARLYLGVQAAAGVVWWVAVFMVDDVRRWTLGSWSAAWLVVPDVVLFVGASALAAARSSRWAAAVVLVWTATMTAGLAWSGLVDRAAGWGLVLMTVALAGTTLSTAILWFGRVPVAWFFVGPFAFREARRGASRRSYLAQSVAQLIVFWSFFLVVLPVLLGWIERRIGVAAPALARLPDAVGSIVFALGSIVGLWSCVSMAVFGRGTPLPGSTATELVVRGPYRWVRNPMAVAGAIQTIGVGLVLGSWLVLASAFAGGVVWNVFIRPSEEADLLERFGSPYLRYSTSVRCWVPRRPTGRPA